jgi:hypothetical protein
MPKKYVDKDGKEHVVFNPLDDTDMKIALGTAKKTLEANEGGQGQTDADAEVEKFKNEAQLEEENEQLKEKMKLVIDTAFEAKKQKIGCSDPEIDTPDKLLAWESGQKSARPEPTGSAPLNYEQLHGGLKKGYDTQAEMIEDLQSRARQGDKNSEVILGQLLVKSLKGVKEGKKGFGEIKTPIDGETEIQRLNRHWREKQLRNRNRD